MTYEDIKYETDGRLAFITLNRPEKLNALSNNLRGEVIHAMKEAEATHGGGRDRPAGRGTRVQRGLRPDEPGGPAGQPVRASALAAAGLGLDAPRPDGVGAARRGDELGDLGAGQAGGRAGAGLLPGRRHGAGQHLRLPHRGGERADRVSAGARHDVGGHGLGALAPADGEGAGVRLRGRQLQRPQDGGAGLGELRRPARRSGVVHGDVRAAHGAHRQRHADVQQARGEPAVRGDGHPHGAVVGDGDPGAQQLPPGRLRVQHARQGGRD